MVLRYFKSACAPKYLWQDHQRNAASLMVKRKRGTRRAILYDKELIIVGVLLAYPNSGLASLIFIFRNGVESPKLGNVTADAEGSEQLDLINLKVVNDFLFSITLAW